MFKFANIITETMDHNEIAKSSISQSLSWTHYIRLMRISDPKERAFYEIEAANNNWSVKELNRQFDSALYQRLALSRDKDKILELSKKGQAVEKPGINECRICSE